jgi:hypothetical protein
MGPTFEKRREPERKPVLRIALAVMTGLWGLLVVQGFMAIVSYSVRAGPEGETPETLIGDNSEVGDYSDLSVLFFVHPKCPCTRASAEALDRLLTQAGIRQPGAVQAHLFMPKGAEKAWGQTVLVDRLERIPAVSVTFDEEAATATSYDVTTSGHLLIYRSGKLVFSGGITPARAHEGNCDATDAALAALTGSGSFEGRWPVFGCPIRVPSCTTHCETAQ